MSLLERDIIRGINIIKRNIKTLNLDLRGLTILTEIGSGPYLLNPLVPIFAGATETIIWCKDTSYGKANEIFDSFDYIISKNFISGYYVKRKNVRPDEDIRRADIITNSGMIRPIDANFISKMKKSAVVPIMYEAWEVRTSDVDVDACKHHGIKVAGTWENHPAINVFNYTGILAIKMLLESNIEIYQSNIYIWSNDEFGEHSLEAFKKNGASKIWLNTNVDIFYDNLSQIDALYICDYHESGEYFGENAIFDIQRIKELKPDLMIIHLYGKINTQLLLENDLNVYPEKQGIANVMSYTLAYVGLEPLLRLQTAGYKVGEDLIRNIENPLIQLL